ncbi:ribulose-phosphate 3-epimerase [Filifactor alocis ATCC 35896]|uniref:Ribulose-phosphate 3-epimerase n=1 Tax=Filifactor alocis (strain ATCC 35896 / CCUG 47790 / D40 B5) TaxID=546269 RepID=D6GS82_FILAD|nr:ribulose-phosphate 3-epimerase [Filifactor alocis]EFE28523.1 ribulose-phosphate 3-epimerase [Filifactor alocis ATCC 35896]
MIKLAPSILSADFSQLAESVKAVENAGCEYLHIDVMDGHFVPNITFGAVVFEKLRKKSNMTFDCHLMIEQPDLYLEDFVKAGADIITVHQEACVHLNRTIHHIKELGCKAGVAINPATSPQALEYVLQDVDMVLIMSVNPGFGGQKFIPQSLDKIKKLKQMIDAKNYNVDIQVDGGVSVDNIHDIVTAGANIVVAGSAIFGKDNIQKAVSNLRDSAEQS